MSAIKTLGRVLLALLLMSIISFLLDLGGIYAFIYLEADNQFVECQRAQKEDADKIEKRLEVTKAELERFGFNASSQEFVDVFANTTRDLAKLHNQEECREWTYLSTMTLVMAIKTTIGWGNIAPITVPGRVFLMLYALVAIPWCGFFIAFIGHIQMRFLWWIHDKRVNFLKRIYFWIKLKREKISAFHYQRRISTLNKPSRPDDPPMWSLVLALAYGVGIGTAAYVYYDELDPFESLYFSFINFTTIGFGDIVPQHKSFVDFFVIGVVVTHNMSILTVCFSIVQDKCKELLGKLKELMTSKDEDFDDEVFREEDEEKSQPPQFLSDSPTRLRCPPRESSWIPIHPSDDSVMEFETTTAERPSPSQRATRTRFDLSGGQRQGDEQLYSLGRSPPPDETVDGGGKRTSGENGEIFL